VPVNASDDRVTESTKGQHHPQAKHYVSVATWHAFPHWSQISDLRPQVFAAMSKKPYWNTFLLPARHCLSYGSITDPPKYLRASGTNQPLETMS
jgi:hypothetical protein